MKPITHVTNIVASHNKRTSECKVIVAKNILIIDDNIIFCHALKYHLSQKEHGVDICLSYSEFKTKKSIDVFDLILLDMRLKDSEGLDILKEISIINSQKKVVIVSSYLDDKSTSKAKELGAHKCLKKNSKLFNELDLIIDQL